MLDLVKKIIYRFAGIDESGDLGMSLKSSKHFILACFMHDDSDFDRKFRKFIGKLNHKKNNKKINSLHARLDSDILKLKVIKFLRKVDFRVSAYVVKKNKPQDGEFNYHKMLKEVVTHNNSDKILVSSPRTGEEFKGKITSLDKRIVLSAPQESSVIQLADMFAWAVFKKLEHRDEIYYRLLSDKIDLVELKM